MKSRNEMSKTELIIQLTKIAFGIYFVWWSVKIITLLQTC